MLDLRVRIYALVFTTTITKMLHESNNNETTGASIRFDSKDVDSGNIRRNLWLRNLEKKAKNGN